MRAFLLTLIFLCTTSLLFAQDDTYAQKAAELQKEIWDNAAPEFQVTKVPDNLSKESAVILARSFSLQRTSTGRLKYMIITAASTTHTVKLSTFHERVKINDKVALEAYSSLEYQKKLDKSVNLLITKFANINNTYIGAKIIKPNGKEIIVNTGEEVLLKNEEKDQKGKLAISGLEVGDILDYYISNSDVNESMQGDSFADNDNLLVLTDEYPILYYGLDFQFNKKTTVKYVSANGAPQLVESTNDAGDQVFSLKLHNLPKFENQLWTSPLRQYPYIEIGSEYTSKFNNFVMGEKAEDANASRLDNIKTQFENGFKEMSGYDEMEKKTKDFFKSGKAFKNAPVDSVCKVLYDEWRLMAFGSYDADELQALDGLNYRQVARSSFMAQLIGMQLTDMKINYDVLLVASRAGSTLDNIFVKGDWSYIIRVNDTKPLYMVFDDVMTQFNELPQRYQGEKVVVLTPERHNAYKYTFTEGSDVLPVIPAGQNRVSSDLQVSLLPGNMQKLHVDRQVTQTGAMRHITQKLLLPVQTVDEGLRSLVDGDDLGKRLSRDPKTKKMKDDFTDAFQKQADDVNKKFIDEIKDEFDQEPEQVANSKIISPALENTDTAFRYSATFVLNNLVKKAGENYIIDAGKLTGGFYKLEDNDRKRNADIYMPCARSFIYHINITIPPGYTAKGMDEMTVKKTNKTGAFIAAATLNGNVLNITVTRVYSHNFEKTADWPLVTELLDVASNFNNQKILLEKK